MFPDDAVLQPPFGDFYYYSHFPKFGTWCLRQARCTGLLTESGSSSSSDVSLANIEEFPSWFPDFSLLLP